MPLQQNPNVRLHASAKTETALVLLCGFVAVIVFAAFNISHLYTQILKKSVYSQVDIFGHDCTVRTGIELPIPGQLSIERLLDQYKDIIAKSESVGMSPAVMPFRQTPTAPVTKPGQILHTRCQLKSEKMSSLGYLNLNLGRVYGDSLLILDPDVVFPLQGGEIAEVYLPLSIRKNLLQLDLLSLGVPSGAAGLGTLLPLYLSSTPESDRAIQRRLDSLYVDQPLFRVGLALVMLLVFVSLWLFGLKYQDIFWMILYATATVMIYLAVYSIPYRFWFFPWIWRIYGVLSFLQVVFLFLFSIKYLRPESKLYDQTVPRAVLISTLLYSVCCFAVSDAIFLKFKLLTFFPSVVASFVFGILSLSLLASLVNTKKDHGSSASFQRERSRREKVLLLLSLTATSVWSLQSIVVEKYAIQIDAVVQGLLLTLFGGFNLYDLAWRQRAYFQQRIANKVEAEKTVFAQNLVRQLNQVAHDLKQPLDYLANRSTQPIESARVAAFALDLIQDLALIDPNRRVVWKKGDITTFCNQICEHFASLHCRRINFACDELFRVQTYDQVLVKRILVNLLQNSIDHTKLSDEIALSITNNRWRVKNSGSPIPELILRAIQTNQTVSQSGFGTGLQFVRDALTKMDSKLEVKSSLDQGTEFSFVIPDPLAQINQFSDFSYFVIDDDFFVKKLWSQRQVNFFSSIADFEKSEWRTKGKVFILDHNFPTEKTTGLQLAQKIRVSVPESFIFLATNENLNAIPEFIDALVEKGPIETTGRST